MGDLLQPTHLIVLAVIVLVLFGGKKLPELGKGLGEGLRGFKDGMKDGASDAPAAATPPAGQVANSQAADKTTIDVEAKQKS